MSLSKVDDTINNSFRKSFLGSLDWFLGVKIDSEKSNFTYLKCMALCQSKKYVCITIFLEYVDFLPKILLVRTQSDFCGLLRKPELYQQTWYMTLLIKIYQETLCLNILFLVLIVYLVFTTLYVLIIRHKYLLISSYYTYLL